jgi:phosphohistidine phosphatase
MTHRIYLLRHAKSSWDDPGLADHERPLAKRGRKATKLLREYIRDVAIRPDLILCSSAARATETLEGIRKGFGDDARVEIEPGLYGAGSAELRARLQAVPEDVGAVMLIGHNPAIEELAEELAREEGDVDARARMQAKYPTGGLATLSFSGAWSELDSALARLEAFVVPRELS